MKTTSLLMLASFAASLCACSTGGWYGLSHSHEELDAVVLDAREGKSIAFPIHDTLRLATAESNVAGMSFFELRIPAGKAGAPPHTHTHEDEFFYIRQGRLTFMAEDARRTLSAGGFVLLPRGGLHAFWNDTSQDAIVLVGTSNGKFDDFFDAVAMEVQRTGAKSPQQVGEILGRLGAEREIFIDMTKLPPDVAALYGAP